MKQVPPETATIAVDADGVTVAAWLRRALPGRSWADVKQLIAGRRVLVDGEPCLDPARRPRVGQTITLAARAAPAAPTHADVVIRHLDHHVVVVEKPTGISTVRYPTERNWPARRKALHPTLEDLLPPLIAAKERDRAKGPLPTLRVVHRIDKETSGLVVFARTVPAEAGLGRQFRDHSVVRRYLTVVPGVVTSQRIESYLLRDRGDKRRGSGPESMGGKRAVTFVEVVERLPGYTLLSCRLETGRTHQIRIHLAEQGHAVCGEKVYNRGMGQPFLPDKSGAPRLALHAAELGFTHPVTGAALHWEMPLPPDLEMWLAKIRQPK